MSNNYINHRGYVIHKNNVPDEQLSSIINDLNVKPFLPKSLGNTTSFLIYRESINKYYLPRFFGINQFGPTNDNRIPKGTSINLQFTGNLRDYQTNIVNKYVSHVGTSGGGLLEIDTGLGKTVIALNIISRLNTKTLIIVHKEFLMNQWIERINEFLPNASIGKIQGQSILINNDIVIGMLQSISMKDYDYNLFNDFGLTIFDEVHHLGAEVFSQALMKINTNYCLGLSATMNRKDGLSKVFKMFLGDIIHTEKRVYTSTVNVKLIEYQNNDSDFNEIVYNFKGDPLYSTMISKLCNFNNRSEFIIDVLTNELKINDNQQIIILAHNRSLLNYLYDSINHKNIATVGFYVGGMKESQLKESEKNKIILATYSMASEGLDIKTLTTLLMATPKTDIVQAVGRILRTTHSNPLIIDIVDNHDLFQKQSIKRIKYYKNQKYNITKTDHINYKNNIWNNIETKNKSKLKSCPFS
tara:strand:+ start:1622 stop:3031 length:1410 start_codon:yes stop_codon:yes gene_type:complete